MACPRVGSTRPPVAAAAPRASRSTDAKSRERTTTPAGSRLTRFSSLSGRKREKACCQSAKSRLTAASSSAVAPPTRTSTPIDRKLSGCSGDTRLRSGLRAVGRGDRPRREAEAVVVELEGRGCAAATRAASRAVRGVRIRRMAGPSEQDQREETRHSRGDRGLLRAGGAVAGFLDARGGGAHGSTKPAAPEGHLKAR